MAESKAQMEAIVRQLGYEPDDNYLLAYNRLNNVAKAGIYILLQQPWIGLAMSEKEHVIIFTPEAIVIHRLKKNGQTQVFPANEIENFRVRDGANKSVVIEFTHGSDSFSYYSYKDFSMRNKYVAENLAKLTANNFGGYAKD
ncbi:hypothetical protein [Lacticaseibacillus zhaodongensis]|uniref:hypothetical protein n=1 Tax=Lacticaseibacillus zhaodongensis TaxID=2668065 RepID=UPI0012D312DD|nr:hypothetical protein [Lacticaseibacillus zhaodongensis]